MEDKFFFKTYNLIKEGLFNLDVNRIFNSIGSNIFIEFGKGQEVLYKNNKKTIIKDWSIWISNASWRITKEKKYIVGSGDSSELIQKFVQQLMGKRFISLQFSSIFLDAGFDFSDGYKLTTFFNEQEEDQWSLFLPDQTSITVDCSSQESIDNVQKIAKDFEIIENYAKQSIVPSELTITKIILDDYDQPTIYFEENYSIILKYCAWRLEKDEDYIIGYLDYNKKDFRNKLYSLIGKKIKQIDIANSLMDAKFQFEDNFSLKTFTCCRELNPWRVLAGDSFIFNESIIRRYD